MEFLTISAILLGPVFAIVVANIIDSKRATHDRRMEVFRVLMRTRRSRLNSSHVSALNLVEIEFQKDENVIQAWQAYFEHLGSDHKRRNDELLSENMTLEQQRKIDGQYQIRTTQERETLLARLLYNMAKTMKYKIEAFDIFEGGYSPQGWAHVEFQNESIRKYVIELLLGSRVLPVKMFSAESETKDVELDQKEE